MTQAPPVHGVVLFHTSASAMKAEALLSRSGIPTRLIPAPRRFTTDCGMALRFPWDSREGVEKAIRTGSLEILAILPL